MMGHGKNCKCMMCKILFGNNTKEELKCDKCNVTFSNKDEMDKHVKQKHM